MRSVLSCRYAWVLKRLFSFQFFQLSRWVIVPWWFPGSSCTFPLGSLQWCVLECLPMTSLAPLYTPYVVVPIVAFVFQPVPLWQLPFLLEIASLVPSSQGCWCLFVVIFVGVDVDYWEWFLDCLIYLILTHMPWTQVGDEPTWGALDILSKWALQVDPQPQLCTFRQYWAQ